MISNRYALLTLQLPLPISGTYQEIVSIHTEIEQREHGESEARPGRAIPQEI